MAVEIERKFLIEAFDAAPQAALGSGRQLRQGYLAEEGDVEVRVRIADDEATLTVKAGRGLSRTEVELEIDHEQAEALWAHTGGRRIDKVRHRLPVGDGSAQVTADVDVYGGALDGLCTAEVEFASSMAAEAFLPPAWFGRELTGEPGWSNAALARDGRPAASGS